MVIVEVSLVMIFGPDQQWVDPYYGGAIAIGIVQLPLRMLVPVALSLAAMASLVAIGLVFGLRRTTSGRGKGAVGGGASVGYAAVPSTSGPNGSHALTVWKRRRR